MHAIEQRQMSGAFNATGPQPVTNAEFMRELRRTVHRPWSPPVAVWAVHIGSRLMGTEACLALTGRRCAPKRFQENGFNFKFPVLHEALADIYGENMEVRS
jgi:NAD dependent epimerase/dehydratase family enzyme